MSTLRPLVAQRLMGLVLREPCTSPVAWLRPHTSSFVARKRRLAEAFAELALVI